MTMEMLFLANRQIGWMACEQVTKNKAEES
jgi:hypothetical protein